METQKKCQNCRYYAQHYSKQRASIKYVNCGSCLHDKFFNQKKEIIDCCEFWEDIVIQKEERQQSIKNSLIDISKQLNELIFILKDDN